MRACFMEEVRFGNETLKGSSSQLLLLERRKFLLKEVLRRAISPLNRRNDERERRLKGTRVKDELTDRMKQGGKGKISISCYCIPPTT